MALDRREVVTGAAAGLGVGFSFGGAGLAAPAAPAALTLEAKPTAGGGMAYNGTVPGPLIRVRLGEAVAVTLRNGLSEPTSVTWHGVRIANATDGVAGLTGPAVPPGGRADIRFTPPGAGNYWYHPHAAPGTAAQTGGGLHGVLIVDETTPPAVDADLLVVLGDRPGQPGAVAINGAAGPMAREARPGARVRLRLVNCCVARIAVVAVTGARPSVIAIDGQPSELFQPPAGTMPIGPGATFELMLDLPAGGAGLVLRGAAPGEADQPLLALKASGTPLAPREPIAKLAANPLLPTRIALEKASRHELAIAPAPGGRWSVNGKSGMPGRPLFTVARGTPVTLTLRNKSDLVQPMHVHGHCWRLLHDFDDGWDPFWRTTVLLGPGRTKHVAFVADNPGRWALAGGDLHRQDAGLATWFEVR